MSLPERVDALVIGARPAGAATAMLLARAGLRVLLVDRGRRGTDTLSTHALMRGGVLQLARWGLLDAVRAAGTPPVRSATFHYAGTPLSFDVTPDDRVDALYAPRRTVLDPILVDAAEAAGAVVRHEVSLVEVLRRPGGRVVGAVLRDRGGAAHRVQAGLLIGADGVRSTVADQVGAAVLARAAHTSAIAYAYHDGIDAGAYHWYFARGVAAGVIPTNGGLANVFAAVPADRAARLRGPDGSADLHAVLAANDPALAEAVAARPRRTPVYLWRGTRGHLRQVAGPGWALVGDAALFKDPLSAHGISEALRDAELLARAAVDGTDAALLAYQVERDALAAELFRITTEIAGFGWDVDGLARIHRAMAREMRREVAAIDAFAGTRVAVAS